MNGQAQMFPLTEEERIATLRTNLASDVEKRQAKRDTAAAALADAQEACDSSLGLLDVFDRMVRERARAMTEAQEEPVEDPQPADEAADPPTDGAPVPTVFVAWPDNPDMQTIEVGEFTRYGNLAATFLNALPTDDPRRADQVDDYRVIGVDDLKERDLHAAIVPADIGLALSVERVAEEVAAG